MAGGSPAKDEELDPGDTRAYKPVPCRWLPGTLETSCPFLLWFSRGTVPPTVTPA